MPPQNTILALEDALSMVFRAMALAEKGLVHNPSKEEARDLNATLVDLDMKRAVLEAKLNALIGQTAQIAPPTAAQVAQVAALTGEVATLTAAAVTASAALALTGRVLALATEIAPA